MKYFFIVIVFLLFLSSCNNKNEISAFIVDTPKNGIERIRDVRDRLKLDILEKGFDSLQIRIWLTQGLSVQQEVVIIKRKNNKWKSTFIEFEPIYYDNYMYDSVLYMKKKEIEVKPKMDWDLFILQLNNFDIMNLPDQGKIKNYQHPSDGGNLVVEIATSKRYRLYTYHQPGSNDSIREARLISSILDLMSKEFSVKLFRM